ncbi:MAG: hypothetical protein ACPGOV_17415 [Magnetovibrionaceae bacterium]
MIVFAFGLSLIVLLSSGLQAAPRENPVELVMFESPVCEWCEKWHDEIGPIYPKTKEGQCAPLRTVFLHSPRPDDLKDVRGVVYTPTFVLMEAGEERGRVAGYPGDEFFWTMLGQVLSKLNNPCPLSD